MAIYYSRLSLISRSQGHSAVAAAAYRAGVRLHDARTDQLHNYSKKRGVLEATMLAPAAASWALDIKDVWNRAETAEVRRNARTARELIVALPAELPQAKQLRLASQFGQDLVDRYGVAVLVATHAPDKKSDDRNVHVHLLMSTRIAGAEGFGAKVRVLDDQKTGPKEAEAMRAGVAARINEALAAHGHGDRVDPRSLRKQSSDAARCGDFDAVVALAREPTRHQGREATAAFRRGELSFVVASNDAVRRDNATVQIHGRARASHLKREVQRRDHRQSTALRAPRKPRLRNGIGVGGRGTKATGSHAELLNAQQHLAQASTRLARDTSEAYLDMLRRESEAHEASVRAYFRKAGIAGADVRKLIGGGRGRAVTPEQLAHASGSHSAWVKANADHEAGRRATAAAELATVRAQDAVSRSETSAPPVWQIRSRRQWAELHRCQRATVSAAKATERSQRASRERTAEDVDEAKHAWDLAHASVVDALKTQATQATEARAAGKRPRPASTPPHETRSRTDSDALGSHIEKRTKYTDLSRPNALHAPNPLRRRPSGR